MSKADFTGEYPVTLDSKNRFLFPAQLRKQIPAKARNTFMLLRSTDKCLVMYPIHDWEILSKTVRRISHFNQENLDALRFLFDGATRVSIDGSGRIMIPKNLLQYAGIHKDMLIKAYLNRIELWDEKTFYAYRKRNVVGMQKKIQKVLGGLTFEW
ncbi:MAG: division/cell wall cluster transcriptional repressor MraZ [Chitinophagales bacterium]|nr:division/cell wall cluster transcriptional repressor MraZ [Chitinophagales bacterium]MDW8428748.1 division/cell wall cluster transcriptional repressor MraZ [Chitinophagales bacterium]